MTRLRKLLLCYGICTFTAIEAMACTIFETEDPSGNILVGRNFDWDSPGGRIWFIPGDERKNAITIFEQYGADMAFEGVNNEGLFIGIAASPETSTPVILLKPVRKSLEMVRVALEESKNTEEAIRSFQKYDVTFGTFLGNPQIHYLIVDRSGKTAVIDFIGQNVRVTTDPNSSRILTNHYVTDAGFGSYSKTSYDRYHSVQSSLGNSPHSVSDVQRILKSVVQDDTIWSTVYDLEKQVVFLSYKNGESALIDLKSEMYKGLHYYNLENLSSPMIPRDSFSFLVRPEFGFGFVDGLSAVHTGGRILFPADSTRRWGIEVTKFWEPENSSTALGIVLEQRFFDYLNISVGTVGYWEYGGSNENPFGIVSNIGWEPDNHVPFRPFITFRNDTIFGWSPKFLNSISVGLSF